MKSPLVSKGGQSYDWKYILQWLHQGNIHCPLTCELLRPSLLVPNNPLKSSIMKWKLNKGVEEEEDHEMNDTSISASSNGNENCFVGVILNFNCSNKQQ
jgi:hypothetical protein